MVSARNPPDAVDPATGSVASEAVVVSSEVGLVTRVRPEVDNDAGRHFAKQTPYLMPSKHRFELHRSPSRFGDSNRDPLRPTEALLQQLARQWVLQLAAKDPLQRPRPVLRLIALHGKSLRHRILNREHQPLLREQRRQIAKLKLHDRHKVGNLKRTETDHLIDSV